MVSSSVDALLKEMESGFVVPELYSRTTLPARLSGIVLATMLASVAVFGSMLLCELTDTSRSQR